MNNYIPYLELPKQLDIKEDDILLVGSDMSKIAMMAIRNEKAFNPSLFITALKQTVSSGTLLFPAYINDLHNNSVFDIKKSEPQTGTLSLTAFKDSDFKRTNDPFHSFMVWGKHTNELIKRTNKSTFGNDSVFAFLHTNKAKMLLIDIDLQHSFTFAHYIEEKEKVKHRVFKTYTINSTTSNNVKESRQILFYEKRNGVTLHLNKLLPIFKINGAVKEVTLNSSLFTIIDLEKSADIITDDIRHNSSRNIFQFNYQLWVKLFIRKFIPKYFLK